MLLLLLAPSNITILAIVFLFPLILSSKTDIDECASHPCKNKGICTDQVNGFNCSCAPGFSGTQCETGNCQSRVRHVHESNKPIFFSTNFVIIMEHDTKKRPTN